MGGHVTHFAFDHSGDWLLTASNMGALHLMRTDGSAYEVLPRPWSAERSRVLSLPAALLGVAGGFVVAGAISTGPDDDLLAAHYDMSARTCRLSRLGRREGKGWTWHYVRDLHCVLAGFTDQTTRAVDLATYETALGPTPLVNRAAQALARFPEVKVANFRSLAQADRLPEKLVPRTVYVIQSTGHVCVVLPGGELVRFTPLRDGRPFLAKRSVGRTHLVGNTLAMVVGGNPESPEESERGSSLEVLRLPDGLPLMSFSGTPSVALSAQGRFLAVQRPKQCLDVREAVPGCSLRAVLPRGRFHSNAVLSLSASSLVIRTENVAHRAAWSGGRLEHRTFSGSEIDHAESSGVHVKAYHGPLPDGASYDARRFRALARRTHRGLVAVLDAFGQVAVFGVGGLVAMFFAFRHQFAAWMPDGTRFGSPELFAGPPTPDAAERIGRALCDAAATTSGRATV
jgi:hypothetical protein